MEELKPCPFCGELPIQFVKDGLTQIRCNNTQCWIVPATSFYTDRKTAVEAWEERVQPNEPLTRDCVEEAPAADVAPVVHGEWLNFNGDFSTAECDKCGELYEVSPDEKPCEDFFSAFKKFYKFCPTCGCKMDGGEKHE